MRVNDEKSCGCCLLGAGHAAALPDSGELRVWLPSGPLHGDSSAAGDVLRLAAAGVLFGGSPPPSGSGGGTGVRHRVAGVVAALFLRYVRAGDAWFRWLSGDLSQSALYPHAAGGLRCARATVVPLAPRAPAACKKPVIHFRPTEGDGGTGPYRLCRIQ